MSYTSINIIGDATSKYNCHAYAWAGSTTVWMPDPSAYWEDTSYIWAGNSISEVGQKVYYVSTNGGMDHSGIVISLSGNQIRSKWGESILVEHAIGDCPYYRHTTFSHLNVYNADGPN